ncbi:MFS transporter [Arthrobacter sp. CAN_C5]|uniref:MFS transporter n=1 Tax=Arthrobacter sp. CAN_C5 TaxID=2760706 RepID=UPI001AE18C21|nr:MFS transporter [Arthrobacter sp. CAN_C5]MBP2215254.1 putative MFS family arabinose efflux permease [Arthrobacter sp. CAN_C5]
MKRTLQSSQTAASPFLSVMALALIAATYGLARLGYGLFLPAFSATFELTPTVGGLLASGASVSYCVSALIGFRFAPTRPRLVAILAGSTAASGSAGVATAQDTLVFAAAVLIAGMGAGFATPALVELVRRNIPAAQMNKTQSVVNSGTGFGVVLAGALALLVGSSWRVAWGLIAVVALGALIGVLRTDRSRTIGGTTDHLVTSTRTSAELRALWHPIMAAFVFGVGVSAVWVHGRILLEDQGMAVALSAGAWIALGMGGAVAVLSAPWLARHSIRTTWLATVVASAVATVVFALAPQYIPLSFAAAALFGLAYTAASSVLIIWATHSATHSAAGTSILFTSLVLGQAVGATLTGSIIEGIGFTAAFAIAAGICLLGVLKPAPRPHPTGRGQATTNQDRATAPALETTA